MEIRIDDIANGGDAVGRIGGKAHFVPGLMPGERAEIEVVDDRGSYARATALRIVEPSPHRLEPPCPYFDRCGGCSWQYAAGTTQAQWREAIVAGQLRHLGRVAEPPVRPTVTVGPEYGYRNRIDLRVDDGRAALVEGGSRRLVAIEHCLLARPEIDDLIARLGPLTGVDRLTLRASAATGERLAVVTGAVPSHAADWGVGVASATRRGVTPVHGAATITEQVAGIAFRISGLAFFQANTAGAETLVRLVGEALAVTDADVLLDGYCGGGLFAATVGAAARRVIAVESAPDSIADARHNLGSALPRRHRIVPGRFERVVPRLDEPWSVAVVDPPRAGLGRTGVAAVGAAEPRTIAYVSCDAASLARDTLLLAEIGYALAQVTPVDMFPQTPHIEAVAVFQR